MRRPAFIARQSSRPSGLLGRMLVRVMASETAAFNREVLAALGALDGERILEVGFGHGRTLAELATALPGASFAGLDVSADAEQVAHHRCRAFIEAGRVELRVGDSASLPWPAATFDRAYAVHTMYFWPEPARDLAELRRVLQPGGTLVLGFRERTPAAEASFPPPTYRFYTVEEVRAMLLAAGFPRVAVRGSTSGPNLRIAIMSATPCGC
jgi:ubiquinone/menaquinone biosynthesis C-methylase UbiE